MDKPLVFTGIDIDVPNPNPQNIVKVRMPEMPAAQKLICTQNKFEQTDPKKILALATSNAATDDWYSGMA
jgi:hypothetical protein